MAYKLTEDARNEFLEWWPKLYEQAKTLPKLNAIFVFNHTPAGKEAIKKSQFQFQNGGVVYDDTARHSGTFCIQNMEWVVKHMTENLPHASRNLAEAKTVEFRLLNGDDILATKKFNIEETANPPHAVLGDKTNVSN